MYRVQWHKGHATSGLVSSCVPGIVGWHLMTNLQNLLVAGGLVTPQISDLDKVSSFVAH